MRPWYRRWEPVLGLIWLAIFLGYWSWRWLGVAGPVILAALWVGVGVWGTRRGLRRRRA